MATTEMNCLAGGGGSGNYVHESDITITTGNYSKTVDFDINYVVFSGTRTSDSYKFHSFYNRVDATNNSTSGAYKGYGSNISIQSSSAAPVESAYAAIAISSDKKTVEVYCGGNMKNIDVIIAG